MKPMIRLMKVVLVFVLVSLLVGNPASVVRAGRGIQVEEWQGLVITRTAPLVATVGQKIWIVIELENTSAQVLEFSWVEHLGDADFDQSQARSTRIYDPGYGQTPSPTSQEGFDMWYYQWRVSLPAGQKTNLAYWLAPRMPGTYVISPARLEMGGQVHKAASMVITVKCVADGACHLAAGENAMTCPDDCPSGAADNLCDGALDGILDPDCEPGYDLDETLPVATATPSVPSPLERLRGLCPAAGALLLLPLAPLFIRPRRSRRP